VSADHPRGLVEEFSECSGAGIARPSRQYFEDIETAGCLQSAGATDARARPAAISPDGGRQPRWSRGGCEEYDDYPAVVTLDLWKRNWAAVLEVERASQKGGPGIPGRRPTRPPGPRDTSSLRHWASPPKTLPRSPSSYFDPWAAAGIRDPGTAGHLSRNALIHPHRTEHPGREGPDSDHRPGIRMGTRGQAAARAYRPPGPGPGDRD